MTVDGWLRQARQRLVPVAAAQAAREARLILGHVTGWSAARVSTAGDAPLAPGDCARCDALLERRRAHEPLAQILGEWPFRGRSFRVTRDTLVPRPDTETLVDLALAAPFARLLDLGTGTGAIAVTLLAERPQARGIATDISAAALEVAAANAAACGVIDRIALLRSDWWQAVTGQFDLVVSNPPYVSEAEYAALAPEITEWEPRAALTPGGDGLGAYRRILAGLGAHLAPGGRVLVEIGASQAAAVTVLFDAAGLDAVTVHSDINDRERVVSAAMPKRHDAG
jgi:release factor glutamine methyltransferase